MGRLGSGADARLEQIQVQCVQFVPVQDSSGVWTLVKQVQPASPVYGTGTTGTLFDWTSPQPPNGYHSFLFSFDGLFTTGGPTLPKGIFQFQIGTRSVKLITKSEL